MTCGFWRPGRPGEAQQWWGRCDKCAWSGPILHFDIYVRRQTHILLCLGDGCAQNPQALDVLATFGFERGE